MEYKTSLLIMTEDSPGSYSPTGERIRHMALAASLFVDKVIVLALRASKEEVEKGTDPKVLSHGLNWTRRLPHPISAFFDPVKFMVLCIGSLILCWDCKPRYVLASVPPLEVGVSAWLLAKIFRVELIIDLRDDWESYAESYLTRYIPIELFRLLFKLAKKTYLSSTRIFVATETIGNTLRKRGINVPILYVPNGADTSIFLPQGNDFREKIKLEYALPVGKVTMLYCGSGTNPYYRLDNLLLAVKALPKDVKEKIFIVFYVYNGIDHLKKLKTGLGISNGLVEIRGPLQRSSLSEVMAACDVGLVPFDDEPYLLCARSTKLYEYLSCGMVVICSGPLGGELDLLFSSTADLGLFTQPTVDGLVQAFSRVVADVERLRDHVLRDARHHFVKESYDRREIWVKAMRTLSATIVD